MAGTTSRADAGDLFIRLPDGVTWVRATALLDASGNVVNGGAITSVIPGVGATNLGKAEDAPAGDGDTVVPVAFVRNDAASSTTSASGDYIVPSTNQQGALYIAGAVVSSADGVTGGTGVRILKSGSATAGQLETRLSLLNGTGTYDMARNNGAITILPSAARTIATDSADFTNFNWRGAIFVIDITAGTTPLLTFTVQGKDPVSGKYFTQLQSLALAAVGTTILYVYPGVTATNNLAATAPLATTFRMDVAVGNANSITYSVGAIPVL